MASGQQFPSCIQCGRRKAIVKLPSDQFKCTSCGCLFDANPDEGGTYSDRNPAARLEREDRRRDRQRDRLGRR